MLLLLLLLLRPIPGEQPNESVSLVMNANSCSVKPEKSFVPLPAVLSSMSSVAAAPLLASRPPQRAMIQPTGVKQTLGSFATSNQGLGVKGCWRISKKISFNHTYLVTQIRRPWSVERR
jgi:hypothetical protein